MCTFTLESTHFIFNKCPFCTHDGASAKFSTNSQETDYKEWVCQCHAKLRVLRSQTDWHDHWSYDHVGLTDWHDHVITSVWQTPSRDHVITSVWKTDMIMWSRQSGRLTWSCDHVGLTDWHDHVITTVWQTDMIMRSRRSDRLTWSCDRVDLTDWHDHVITSVCL